MKAHDAGMEDLDQRIAGPVGGLGEFMRRLNEKRVGPEARTL